VTFVLADNFADVGLVRGKDGVLHVLWGNGSGSAPSAIFDTPISARGVVGRTARIVGNVYTSFPDAAATSTGLAAFWNSTGRSPTGTPAGTFSATRPRGGGSWHLSSSVAAAPSTGWDFSVSAAAGHDGKPWVAFGYSGDTDLAVLHYGHPEQAFAQPSCCVLDEGIGVDSRSGATWLTYFSDQTGHTGSILAADPYGRLWVAWYRPLALFVRRAAAGASRFGAERRVPLPRGTTDLWKAYISAQAGRLDIVALLTVRGKLAFWTTQVLPPR